MKQQDYEKEFDIASGATTEDSKKAEKALEHALDIRKFEIGLYWQRATYFWALIAAAFAGYFAILGAEHLDNKELLAFLISCIGFIFTWAWFQVNRGSKFWQENWENHVDMLEDSITGPLYKTVMRRPQGDEIKMYIPGAKAESFLEKHVTGPKAISASKTNQLVSLFTLILWLGLIIYSVIQTCPSSLTIVGEIVFGVITIVFFLLLYKNAGTYGDDQSHIAKKRGANIVGP